MKQSQFLQVPSFPRVGVLALSLGAWSACDPGSSDSGAHAGGQPGLPPAHSGSAGRAEVTDTTPSPTHAAPEIADSRPMPALAHLPLATPQLRVQAMASASRASDAIVVLAESDAGNGHVRLSLRQALPTQDPPDLSKVWATQDLADVRALTQLSAVATGEQVAVLYGFVSGTAPNQSTHFGLLRYDADGSLLRGPDEPALFTAVPDTALCELSGLADEVLLTCAAAGKLSVLSCSRLEPCRNPVVVDTDTGVERPPSAISTAGELQLYYEAQANQKHVLRRTVVDSASLSVIKRQDLLVLPVADKVSKASAVRVGEEVLAAFGFPRQVGLWDIEGNQLRVTTADPASEQWGSYWVSSHRYGPMMAAGGFVYALEATPYAQLDVFGTALNVVRIDPSSLATQIVEDLSGVTTFYANGDRFGAYRKDFAGLTYLTLPGDASEPIGCHPALPGIVASAFSGISCDSEQCRVLMRQPLTDCPNRRGDEQLGLWSVRRDSGQVAAPAHPRLEWNMRGWPMHMTPERVVLSYGAEDGQPSHLEIYDAPESAPTVVPDLPSSVAARFSEGEKLRVFLHTDTPQVFDYGSLEGEAIVIEGSTGPINPDKLYNCDGLYYSILDGDTNVEAPQGFELYRFDPKDAMRAELYGSYATLDSFAWSNGQCSGDRLYLLEYTYDQDSSNPGTDAFVQVHALDGSFVARVALPKRVAPIGYVARAGRFHVVWKAPDDPSMFGLTIIERDGLPTQHLLVLPSGQRWSSYGPIEVAAGELRMPWLAQDGTPYASMWRLEQ